MIGLYHERLFLPLKYGNFINVPNGDPQLGQIPGKMKISQDRRLGLPLQDGAAGGSSATESPSLRFHFGSAILPMNSMKELSVGSSSLRVKAGIDTSCFPEVFISRPVWSSSSP